MEELVEFVCANWRLVYTVYRGHPDSYHNVLTDFHESEASFTCFNIPSLWEGLFCGHNPRERLIATRSVFSPGNLYRIEATDHRFCFVFVSEDCVLYSDYYEEARGVARGFRASIMTGDEMRDAIIAMRGCYLDPIIAFHGAESADDLEMIRNEVECGRYLESIAELPIRRIPNKATLLEVCFTHGLANGFAPEEDVGLPAGQAAEYYAKWIAAFNKLAALFWTKAHNASLAVSKKVMMDCCCILFRFSLPRPCISRHRTLLPNLQPSSYETVALGALVVWWPSEARYE